MIITEKKAKRLMKTGKAFAMRFNILGERLSDATKYAPDDTWSYCLDNDRRYAIIENINEKVTMHVEV